MNLVLYVTNNVCKTPAIVSAIEHFNKSHVNENAYIYGLDDIKEIYYGKPIVERHSRFSLSLIPEPK